MGSCEGQELAFCREIATLKLPLDSAACVSAARAAWRQLSAHPARHIRSPLSTAFAMKYVVVTGGAPSRGPKLHVKRQPRIFWSLLSYVHVQVSSAGSERE